MSSLKLVVAKPHAKRAAIEAWMEESEEQLVLLDHNFDDAILGLIEGWNGDTRLHRVAYSRDLIIEELIRHMGEDLEGASEMAEEFFEVNIAGAYVGPHSPMFLITPWEPE